MVTTTPLLSRVRAIPSTWWGGALFTCVILGMPEAASPQHAGNLPVAVSPAAPASPVSPAPQDEFGRGTPRGTVLAFLEATSRHDYTRAAQLLDLRRLSAASAARGPEIARQLRVVLDNTRMDLDTLADRPEGREEPGIPATIDVVGRVVGDKPVSILLEQVPRDDGALIWKFSAATVARVPELYRSFTYGVVGDWLPPVFVEKRFLRLAFWQWAGVAATILAALAIAVLVVRPSMPLAGWVLRRLGLDPALAFRSRGPIRLLMALAVFRAGRAALWLPVTARPAFAGVERVLLVVGLTWLAWRVVDIGALAARHALANKGELASLPLVEFGRRMLKIVVSVFAALVLLEAAGVEVSALVAALGVGGIGLALAAQRTIENLFGGLAVIGDQPVRVGDFCRFGGREGTVERIGLWSTRVRTLDRSVVSIPNAQFVSLQIDNLARRDRILFTTMLPLRRETTPDQLRWVLVRLREMLYAHPEVDAAPARVRFAGFAPSALDVEIFAYVLTTDWEVFLAVREECLRTMDIVAAAGTALALPSQTNYAGAEGLDAERARAAASEVARWRDAGALPFPEFSAERIRALRETHGDISRADGSGDFGSSPRRREEDGR